ncbi:hypothetical protein WOLCODRAFT_109909 [Wolfiporia cocos MD-104 SS10]|uniref:PIG-F-domain-containing protein n=1 Tax=Wolfiporia cocos (strain MD-104) TaxID=742152 RepID=A0A2H3JN80_WOLCO|nr:hypothetical protein WOLCODRAFT_109909 [Wolfiporia cocos MD-104 SS10]
MARRKAVSSSDTSPHETNISQSSKSTRADRVDAGTGKLVAFPFARYISAAGVHTCLLVFIAFFLPRTSLSSLISSQSHDPAEQTTSSNMLTQNPTRTVLWMCGGTMVLQAWWGGWLRTWSLEQRSHARSEKDSSEVTKHKLERNTLERQRIEAFRKAAVTTAAASVAFYILIVLFGAPIASYPLQTYSLGLLLALLTIWTPAYALGALSFGSSTDVLVLRMTWIRLFAELRPRTPIERAMVYPAVGAAIGCWSGAIPIGLDWERPWQAWPLTSAFGAISGYILGSLAALLVSGVAHLAQTDILSSPLLSKAKKQTKKSNES